MSDLKYEDVKAAAEYWAKREAKEAQEQAKIAQRNEQIRRQNRDKAGAFYSLLFLVNFFSVFLIIKKWRTKWQK